MSDSLSDILAEFDRETEERIQQSNRALAKEKADAKKLRRLLDLPEDHDLSLAKIGNLIKQRNGQINVTVEIPGQSPLSLSGTALLNASLTVEALAAEKERSRIYKERLSKYEEV